MLIIMFIILLILLSIPIITIFLISEGYYISSIVVYIGLFLIIACLDSLTIKQKSNNDINTRYEELTSEKIETEV